MRITINKQTEPVSIESGDKLVLRLGWDKKSKQRIEIYRDAKDVIDISIFSDDNRLFTIDKETLVLL